VGCHSPHGLRSLLVMFTLSVLTAGNCLLLASTYMPAHHHDATRMPPGRHRRGASCIQCSTRQDTAATGPAAVIRLNLSAASSELHTAWVCCPQPAPGQTGGSLRITELSSQRGTTGCQLRAGCPCCAKCMFCGILYYKYPPYQGVVHAAVCGSRCSTRSNCAPPRVAHVFSC
jgi:hypothetical protein